MTFLWLFKEKKRANFIVMNFARIHRGVCWEDSSK
jgi:hypothetical protein